VDFQADDGFPVTHESFLLGEMVYNDGEDFTILWREISAMSDVTLEQVLELADQLSAEERAALVEHIQASLVIKPDYGVTGEQLLRELEDLRASGAFEHVESLRGKYANPNVDISAEELDAYLHEIATEWEKELDEFFGDDTP
jgi:hypothetical protein